MSDLRRSRRAVAVVFLTVGIATATWAPQIPYVTDHVGISKGTLGLAILCMAFGAVTAMILSAPLSGRFGPHRVTHWTGAGMLVVLPLPVLAPSVWTLFLAMMILGACIGTMDVAMNAVAADVEFRYKRPIMSSFHGMYSLGGLVGSVVAARVIAAGVTPLEHTAGMAIILLVVVWSSFLALPPASRGVEAGHSHRIRWPHGTLLVIGVLSVVVLMAEGAVFDWGALTLRNDFGAPERLIPWGLGAFSATMAIGRFLGDRINAHAGPTTLVGGGLALASVGLGSGLLIGTPESVIAGFAVMGFGLSNAVPVIFTAAASRGRTAAEGISSIAALGYVGFLVGPPLIGFVADWVSLPAALGALACLCGLAVFLARMVAPVRGAASA